MRNLLMIASAAALAISMPALAKEKGNGGGGGGGKPEKHQGGGHGGGGHGGGGKAHKEFRGGGGGGWEHRSGGGGGEKRFEQARKHSEKRFEERRKFADKRHEAREKRFEEGRKHAEKRFEQRRKWAEKAEKRQEKRWKDESKHAERFVPRDDRREYRRARGEDRYEGYGDRYQQRYAEDFGGACPPGLARKNNGCLPPGQAKKMFNNGARTFSAGQVLPLSYYSEYNIPAEYQDWYQDSSDHYYRYDDGGYIYQVDSGSNLIESLIPLLGGGFGVGQLLPAGYDTYNLPMQYRDDFQDSDEAHYRYGDDAIYQVDPQSQMIEGIVALLGGDLNVGGLLPSGYDTYNLPMDYRDDYVDDADSMYRYADGNIYEVDPKTQIIEQIVASLI